TINDMLKLSGKLRSFDPNEVRTYRIDGRGAVLGGQSVIIPDVNAPTTAAILTVFRGEARIADTPDEAADANSAAADAAAATDAATTTTIAAIAAATSNSAATTTTAAAAGAATTVPSITVPPNSGVTVITPPVDPTCR